MSGFDSIVVDAAEGAVSLVPGGGILVAAGKTAKGVVAFLTSRLGIACVSGLLVAASLGVAVHYGVRIGQAEADVKEARQAQADAEARQAETQRQARASMDINERAQAREASAAKKAQQQQAVIDAYKRELAKRPAQARCALDDFDLRSLRPGAGRPSRPVGAPAAAGPYGDVR